MIKKIKSFIKEAGAYAEERRCREHSLSFKTNGAAAKGIVTETDKYISQAFKKFVSTNFSDMRYLIIDEESLDDIAGKVFHLCKDTDYQFIIDPIDGTMNYAAGVPLYGITIGVLKKGKPWLGFLYAPAEKELVYTDGKKVYRETNNQMKELSPGVVSSSRIVQGHAWKVCLPPRHFEGQLVMQDYFSAVIYCLYLALGRVRGIFMQANLWDIAGGWAVMKKLGMGLYAYEDQRELSEFSSEFFDEQCHVKQLYIGCFEKDFDMLKGLTSAQRKDENS